jgi:hypothetical protein
MHSSAVAKAPRIRPVPITTIIFTLVLLGLVVWRCFRDQCRAKAYRQSRCCIRPGLRNASFDKGVANELRHTIGAGLWRNGLWAYDFEGMYQFGSFGVGNIRAWRGVVEASRGFAGRWNPRVKIDFDIASGDQNRSSSNLGTFNSLFQGGEYSGRAQLLGASNSIRLEPTLRLAPRRNISVSTRWGFYWCESEQDGLYEIPGNLIIPSNGVPGRYEGSRPIAEVGWTLNPHLSAHLNYIFVFNGRFEERSVHATTTENYICPWIAYRF